MKTITRGERIFIIISFVLIVITVSLLTLPSFVRATIIPHAVDKLYAPKLNTHTEKTTTDVIDTFAEIGIPTTKNKASCINVVYGQSFTYHRLRETVDCEQHLYSEEIRATDQLALDWSKHVNQLQRALDKNKWRPSLDDATADYSDLRHPGNIYANYNNEDGRYSCHMNIEYMRDQEYENNSDYENSTAVRYNITCVTKVSFFGGWNGLIIR